MKQETVEREAEAYEKLTVHQLMDNSRMLFRYGYQAALKDNTAQTKAGDVVARAIEAYWESDADFSYIDAAKAAMPQATGDKS